MLRVALLWKHSYAINVAVLQGLSLLVLVQEIMDSIYSAINLQ
jgi:hypothetical protein